MNLKLFIFSLFFISLSIFAQPQKVKLKIKNGIVYVNNEKCLLISGDYNNVTFSNLDGKEILFLKFIHNTRYASVYNKITFLESKKTLTSSSYIFSRKILIKKLIEEGVLSDCSLIDEKVSNFVLKFDENVEGR